MKFKSPLDLMKLFIPIMALILLLFSRFTPLGESIKMEDSIIFMLCGLCIVTGIENYKTNIGFFLISSSVVIVAMRLLLIFRL